MKKHWSDKLVKLSACKEAVIWAQDFPTVTAAWAQCEQGNWMLWLCRQLPIKANSKRAYVQTALAIAESVKQHCAHISEAKLARDATQAWLDNPCAKTRAAAWAARAAAEEADRAAAWAAQNKIAADIARQYLICPIKDQAVKGRAT